MILSEKPPSPQPRRGASVFSVLTILDPLLGISGPYNLHQDTSHLILLALFQRGHRISITDPSGIEWRGNVPWAVSQEVTPLPQAPYFNIIRETRHPLSSFDLILMRKDPPVDTSYLLTTQALSIVSKDVCVLNDPKSLRDWNEKLVILQFPRWIPPTLVSSHPDTIDRFIRSLKGEAIAKPLDGFASRGILKLDRSEDDYPSTLESITQGGRTAVMIQKYLPRVVQGEKRIFMFDGKPLGALLKKPCLGNFLTNPDHGATLHPTRLTLREKKMCREIGAFLRKHKVFWAGIDVIDGWLTEINITSPGLLWEWNEVDGKRHEETIVDQMLMKLQKTARI